MVRFLGSLVFALTASAAAAQAPTRPGDGFDVEDYHVAIRPDVGTLILSGRETITVRAMRDISVIAFSANALGITAPTADSIPVRVSSSDGATLFHLTRRLRAGERTTLRFAFEGRAARGVSAIPNGLYTSYFACDWMVCLQDAPGDKARLTLDLFLPMELRSLGVGRQIATADVASGLTRHRWRSRRPYSAYLYAFAAGPFEQRTRKTPQGTLHVVDGTGAQADLGSMMAQSAAIAAFLADKAGMPLPDRHYAQLLVPGREAQESASFSLIGQGELDLERAVPTTAWVIAHEMAHQWWGNLITCATWQDFWLNEGIATFMVAAWQEHSFGPDAYRRELANAERRLARARELGFDKPLAWGGRYPSLAARRGVQYFKGALFLNHLRGLVGDAAFWRGLRRFTRDHAGRTVTSVDFQREMEVASGRDLSGTFGAWVYGN